MVTVVFPDVTLPNFHLATSALIFWSNFSLPVVEETIEMEITLPSGSMVNFRVIFPCVPGLTLRYRL